MASKLCKDVVKKVQFPCAVCDKAAGIDTIQCDGCNLWVHRACVPLSKVDLADYSKSGMSADEADDVNNTWQPPFAADIDKFVFTPRVQQLNMLEAKSRIKLRFMDHLSKFWQLQGISLKVPKIEQKSLDLYSLHKIVEEEGGFEMISRDGNWSKVVSRLGCQTLTAKNVASIVQHHYEKLLYPYDIFLAGATFDSKDLGDNDSDSSDENTSSDDDDVVFVKMEVSPTSTASSSAGDAKHDVKSDLKPSLKMTCSGDGGPQIDSKTDREARTPVKAGKNDVNLAAFNNELKKLQFLGAGPKMALPDIGTIVDEAFHDRSENTKYKRRRTRDKKLSLSFCESVCRTCETCGSSSHGDELLVCDSCRNAFHNFCLIPPLKDMPRKVWRCAKCIAQVCRRPNMAFGFRQADCEYSLQSFGEMADKFKSEYFGVPIHTVSCATVEKEFWRLVHSIDDDVSVEYGADNPVGDEFGSGFPTEKTRHQFPDDDEYINSPWNLNNMPVHKKSLLRYINADISGMKVPWCYVGMCFSCFAWHTEDHWTFSVNYLHWGEPKTWYGVPGCDAEKLERVMKNYAPELFEQSPDLIHQLTTTMDPTLLMAAGVSVVRTDQHAGEIVFTFPRSYHAGFNQGYNFAEAVNFTISDWLPMGRASIDHYRQLKRQLVFSHDEMVCKMASLPIGTLDPHEALMAYQDMLVMVEEEKRLRKIVFDKGTVDAEREAFELLPDDERQCEICKTTCFLSAITCECSEGKLSCINDADDLCRCHSSRRCLRYRYTLNELLVLLSRLKDFIDEFNSWAARARAIVKNTPDQRKPDVTELRQLVTEAEMRNYVETLECKSLAKSIAVVDRCAEIAERFGSFTADIDTKMEDSSKTQSLLTVAQLQELQGTVDEVCCTVPDGPFLTDLLSRIKKFQVDVGEAVAMEELDAEKLRTLLKSDLLIHVDLPERTELKKAIQQLDWLDEVNRTMSPADGTTVVTLTAVRQLVESGVRLGRMHASCAKRLAELQQTFTTNSTCEQKAARYLVNRPYQLTSTLEIWLTDVKSCSLTLPSIVKLTEAVEAAKAWNTEAEQLLCQPDGELPWYSSVKDLVTRGRLIPICLPQLPKLESHLLAARGWLELVQRAFLLDKFNASLLEVLSPRTDVEQGKVERTKNAPRLELDQLQQDEAKELSTMLDQRARNLASSSSVSNARSAVRCQLCCRLFEVSRGVKTQLCSQCHRTRCPKLSEILSLLTSLKRLYVRVPEGILLQRLADRASQWLDRVRTMLADESVLAIVRQKENNSDGNTIRSIADCIENCLPADGNTEIQAGPESTSSKEIITQLVSLMVEGDLLPVELCEKESLFAIVATVCPDVYRLPSPVPETSQAKRKMSLDDDASAKSRRSSCDSSVAGLCVAATKHEDATDFVVILDSDDDDNVADDDDNVEGCAADVCLRPIGDDLLWIQCSECDRCYHFQCVGLDSKSSSSCLSYICRHCVPAASKPTPSANSSGFCSRKGSTDDSLSGMKHVLAQLSALQGHATRTDLGTLLVPISRNSSAKPAAVINRADDDVIVIE